MFTTIFESRAATATSGLLARFRRRQGGVVAVEFAMLAPLLVTLMLGSIELTQSLWASGKLDQATATVGDLISQETALTDGQVEGLAIAAPLILRPYPEANLALKITSIKGCLSDPDDPDSDMDYYVTWSRNWSNGNASGSPYTLNELFPKQPDSFKVIEGDTLIVTESTWSYTPTIARELGTTVPMSEIAFHQPREVTEIAYPAAEDASTLTCDDYRG